MEDVRLDDERECHWRMVFADSDGGVGDKKSLMHANSWYVQMKNK